MSESERVLPNDSVHVAVADELPAYALGSLDAASATRLEDHLARCPSCRAVLREYQEVTRLLPLALPAARPPGTARSELLSRVGSDTRRSRRVIALWKRTPVRLATAAVAAVLAVAIGVGVWSVTREDAPNDPASVVEQLESSPDVRVVSMAGSQNAPGAVGQLIIKPDAHQAGLIASGLPTLKHDHCYQVWFVRPDGTRVSGGIFWPDDTGGAVTLVDLPENISDFKTVGVTEEVYPGSSNPTGQAVLRGGI